MADSHGHLCNNYWDGIEKQKICETKGQEILDPRLGKRLHCCVGYIANGVPLCLYHSRLQACGKVPNWRWSGAAPVISSSMSHNLSI